MPWRPNTAMIVMRLLVSAVAVALGVALVVRGNTVIGVLMVALGIGRVVLFLSWQRRRAQFEQRFANRRRRRQG